MEKVNFKYVVDPQSIMVINQSGSLRRLYCPFRVLCVIPVKGIGRNTWCYVEKVESNLRTILDYHINGKRYPYRNFQIYILF